MKDADGGQSDALSVIILRHRPELAGQVHYVAGQPWCDGVNHTTRCEPVAESTRNTTEE